MAGVTNLAYRTLCREQGAPLAVCEMVTSRGIVERIPKTKEFLAFAPDEIRSVQIYGVEPRVMAEATRILCGQYGARHVDLNFGCPVRKVTRRGGGGALPWKRDRLEAILTAVVKAAQPYQVPITVKTRLGIDDDHLTYRDTGRIAQAAGCAAVTLHGRTVQQAYAGQADWDAIGELVALLDIPVLGNGDIWEAPDALAMMRQTGCAGVVVGRGCLGRPWLFRDLARAFSATDGGDGPNQVASVDSRRGEGPGGPSGEAASAWRRSAGDPTAGLGGPGSHPKLGEVCAMLRRHAELLADLHGETHGLKDLRKHTAWYFKGYPLGGELRHAFSGVASLAELDALIAQLDPEAAFPQREVGKPRGRQGSPRSRVVLPYGWLDSQTLGDEDISAAESDSSGG
jgi:nifR3 family TIM-barrel protein